MGRVLAFKRERVRSMCNIIDVAKYFLNKLNAEPESSITPLKLQKLCYYAQAWSMVWDDKELFKEDFQAWAHGPANPRLYDLYKGYRLRPIEIPEEIDLSKFSEAQIETMNIIWNEYGIYDGKYLERLTHQEQPWIEARGNCKDGQKCDTIISKESIREYFSRLYESEEV